MSTQPLAEPNMTPADALGRKPDWMTIWFLGAASVMAILIVIVLYPDYRFNKHYYEYHRLIQIPDYSAALAHARALNAISPDDATYAYNLANCLRETGNYREALTFYEKADQLKKQQTYPEMMGICYYELGEKEKAMPLFQAALAKDPNNARANFYLGIEAIEAGRYIEGTWLLAKAPADPAWQERARPYREKATRAVLGDDLLPQAAASSPATAPGESSSTPTQTLNEGAATTPSTGTATEIQPATDATTASSSANP